MKISAPFSRNQFDISTDCRERMLSIETPEMAYWRSQGLAHAGSGELQPSYEIHRNFTESTRLWFTLSGSGEVNSPEGRLELRPGTVWISPPDSWEIYKIHDAPWRMVWVCLEKGHANWAPAAEHQVHPSRQGPALRRLLSCVMDENEQPNPDVELIEALTRAFLRYLVGYMRSATDNVPESNGTAVRRCLESIFEQVRTDLTHPWTVEMLNERSGLNQTSDHFARLCRRYFDAPPMKLVVRARMEQAARLLIGSDYPMSQIAKAVGYGDQFAFSTAFKRWAGIPPRRYRQNGPPDSPLSPPSMGLATNGTHESSRGMESNEKAIAVGPMASTGMKTDFMDEDDTGLSGDASQ